MDMKQGYVSHPTKYAAPQLFTGASAPKKKGFVGPVQSHRIRQTFYDMGGGRRIHASVLKAGL
jgi:hypothetical protein